MNSKREANKMVNPSVMWKERPPGPEQKQLEKMFAAKEIDPSATPDSVRKSNPMFENFTASVFASHFRKTKSKLGLCGTI